MKQSIFTLAFLLCSSTLFAQAYNYTLRVTSPFNESLESSCGEGVSIDGTVHGIIHLTRPPNDPGTVMLETHVGPNGDVKAIGSLTGQVYNVVGETFNQIKFSPSVNGVSYRNMFYVVGLYKIHYTYHVLMDGNLENIKCYVDSLKVTCK